LAFSVSTFSGTALASVFSFLSDLEEEEEEDLVLDLVLGVLSTESDRVWLTFRKRACFALRNAVHIAGDHD
jgi:hypothetical protein